MNDLLSQEEIDALLADFSDDAPEEDKTATEQAVAAQPQREPAMPRRLERILDLPMQLSVNLGETRKTLGEVLALNIGSVVEFAQSAEAPVAICLDGKLIARGEVVIIEEHFAVRITEIISPAERAQKMGEG
ncbi:MAG: hypothetical protein GX357_00580 [Firmicutes bacterium]|nr:hypothetical protein [Bacillota bacterium]